MVLLFDAKNMFLPVTFINGVVQLIGDLGSLPEVMKSTEVQNPRRIQCIESRTTPMRVRVN